MTLLFSSMLLLWHSQLFYTVSSQTLSSVIASHQDLSSLALRLSSDAFNTLDQLENITFFAPNNAAVKAFEASPLGQRALNNNDLITAILYYHAANGMIYINETNAAVASLPRFPTTLLTESTYTNLTDGQAIGLENQNGNTVIRTGEDSLSQFTQTDISFDQGVLHIIESFFAIPSALSTTSEFLNLLSFVGASAVADILQTADVTNYATAFIPNNDAFRLVSSSLTSMTTSELADVLKYHVVSGDSVEYYLGETKGFEFGQNGSLTTLNGEKISITTFPDGSAYVNNARILSSNHLVANGVIHVLDNVLNPSNTTAVPDLSAASGLPAFANAASSPTGAIPFISDVPKPTETPSATTGPSTSTKSPRSGLSAGAKAGIVVGVAIICLTAITVAVYLFRKSKSSQAKPTSSGTSPVAQEVPGTDAERGRDSKFHEMESDLHAPAPAYEMYSPTGNEKSKAVGLRELDGDQIQSGRGGHSSWVAELDSQPIQRNETGLTFVSAITERQVGD